MALLSVNPVMTHFVLCNFNTHTYGDHVSGIQDGENLVHMQVQANAVSPKVSVQKPASSSKRSPLAELLVYPILMQKKAKPKV